MTSRLRSCLIIAVRSVNFGKRIYASTDFALALGEAAGARGLAFLIVLRSAFPHNPLQHPL
jgi:hypothetical protein